MDLYEKLGIFPGYLYYDESGEFQKQNSIKSDDGLFLCELIQVERNHEDLFIQEEGLDGDLDFKFVYTSKGIITSMYCGAFRVEKLLKRVSHEFARELIVKLSIEKTKEVNQYSSILRRMFPGKTVTTIDENSKPCSYILIDEQRVTSTSNRNSTTIRDFVFKIDYAKGDEGMCIASIKGQVFTATEKQIMSSYAHSHVQRNGIKDFASCCFGNTPLQTTFGRLKIKLDETNFELFIIQLMDFIKYESTSSGPFVRISSIYQSNTSRIDTSHVSAMFDELVGTNTRFKINITEDEYGIKCSFDKDSLSEALLNCGISNVYIGKIVDNNFISSGNDTHGDRVKIDNFLTSGSLNVKDDHCEINLNKNVFTEDEEELMSKDEYVDPEFMKVFERMYSKYFELFIINKLKVNEIETNNIKEPVTEGQLSS